MTKNELRDALRQHRLDAGLTYRELYLRAAERNDTGFLAAPLDRLSHSTIHRFLAGHKISDLGAHQLHAYWLRVLDGE
jgi:hypothetical protein